MAFVNRWCYKSALLKLIGQFSHDGIGCKTHVKFVNSRWSVPLSFDLSIVIQINPFTPKILISILLTVCHILLII